MPTAKLTDSIWTRSFALLCLAEFLGYAQHFSLQPALPLYITHLGGSPFIVGLVIAGFGVTSVISRPIIGYWVDRWKEADVMLLGMIGQAASILFCFLPFNAAILFSNALRGIGWSGMTAAGYTLLATAAPQARRGEASGYFRGLPSTATILVPAISLLIIAAPFGGPHAVFVFAIFLVVIGGDAAAALSPATVQQTKQQKFGPAEALRCPKLHVL